MTKPWVEKYRPKSFDDIKGQDEAISKVKKFLEDFKNSKTGRGKSKKAMLLHGSPGTGKTTLALVAAKEYNAEIFELNASDLRNKDKLSEILRPAMQQMSLLYKTKIILVDEVDGITGTDRGGMPELISLIDNSKFPVILTANDAWNKKLQPLRTKTEILEMKEVDYKIIKDVLTKILLKEKKFVDENSVTKISVKSNGDLRAAINDLQTIADLLEEDSKNLNFDQRNKELDIFNALKKIFQMKPSEDMLSIYDSVNLSLDEIFLWVEENIPHEYNGRELAKAIDKLSRADVFKGRIYKQQYWRFMVYENIFLSYGISAAKKQSKYGFTKYKKPTRILKIWMNNQRTVYKKSISQKYASHCSYRPEESNA